MTEEVAKGPRPYQRKRLLQNHKNSEIINEMSKKIYNVLVLSFLIYFFLQMKLIYMTIKKSDKNIFQIFNYNSVVLRVISYNSLMTREY